MVEVVGRGGGGGGGGEGGGAIVRPTGSRVIASDTVSCHSVGLPGSVFVLLLSPAAVALSLLLSSRGNA